MGEMLKDLAEIQSQIADLRRTADHSPPAEAEAINWLANKLEARARELDGMA